MLGKSAPFVTIYVGRRPPSQSLGLIRLTPKPLWRAHWTTDIPKIAVEYLAKNQLCTYNWIQSTAENIESNVLFIMRDGVPIYFAKSQQGGDFDLKELGPKANSEMFQRENRMILVCDSSKPQD